MRKDKLPLKPKVARARFRVLQITHAGFKAEAIWKKLSGQWVCVAAPPSIDGIVETLRPAEAEKEMASRGWTCSWL